jgi:hypothetical protein
LLGLLWVASGACDVFCDVDKPPLPPLFEGGVLLIILLGCCKFLRFNAGGTYFAVCVDDDVADDEDVDPYLEKKKSKGYQMIIGLEQFSVLLRISIEHPLKST